MSRTKYFIGLGNPGIQYSHTRHNIGFLFLDYLSSVFCAKFFNIDKLYQQAVVSSTKQKSNISFIKPLTYMNFSGKAVEQLIIKEKIALKELLVIYDDIYLPFGRHRFRTSGSAGGHNGIKNIIDLLGTQTFNRLRLGIGHPEEASFAKYVLSPFSENEKEHLGEWFKYLLQAVTEWKNDIPFSDIMSHFNMKKG